MREGERETERYITSHVLYLRSTTLEDLVQLKPSVGKHLQALLEYDDDDFDTVYSDIKFDVSACYTCTYTCTFAVTLD